MSITSAASPRTRRPWTPTDNDHLIYRWVKMDGETQSWVADQFGISQATVSRIVERYERWQAHAADRENGRLDHTERLRAQRWLTFQRNEQIVTSCLRLAGALEGFVDSSRSTTQYPAKLPSQDQIVRTQHFTIDRTASASRFLRLAYRVNMEQLKLAQLDPPPPAEPLTPEEFAAEEASAAADAQELHEARERSAKKLAAQAREQDDSESIPAASPSPSTVSPIPSPTLNLEPGTLNLDPPSSPISNVKPETWNLKPETSNSAANNVNNLHTTNTEEITSTPKGETTFAPEPSRRKKSAQPCIPEPGKQQWPVDAEQPRSKRRRPQPVRRQRRTPPQKR